MFPQGAGRSDCPYPAVACGCARVSVVIFICVCVSVCVFFIVPVLLRLSVFAASAFCVNVFVCISYTFLPTSVSASSSTLFLVPCLCLGLFPRQCLSVRICVVGCFCVRLSVLGCAQLPGEGRVETPTRRTVTFSPPLWSLVRWLRILRVVLIFVATNPIRLAKYLTVVPTDYASGRAWCAHNFR